MTQTTGTRRIVTLTDSTGWWIPFTGSVTAAIAELGRWYGSEADAVINALRSGRRDFDEESYLGLSVSFR